MVPYKRMYFYLFNQITDALHALETGDKEGARRILTLAQQEAEELCISAAERRTEKNEGCG